MWARALLTAVVFAGVNVLVYCTSGYFTEQRKYVSVAEGLRLHPDAQILFAGDSHIAHRLTPIINSAPRGLGYSVAYQGDSLRECYAKLSHALEISGKIDTIVLSAEPHMFGKGRLESSNRAFADRYFIAARDASGLEEGFAAALLNEVPLFNDDFVQYMRKVAVNFRRSHGGRGGQPQGSPEPAWSALSDAQRIAQARATGRMDHLEIGQHREPFVWYLRILDLAREHHVRVIGIRTPVHREYVAFTPPAQVTAIDRFLRRNGVAEILDLSAFLTDPADFDDPDHLSERGAQRLLSELEKYFQKSLEK